MTTPLFYPNFGGVPIGSATSSPMLGIWDQPEQKL